MKRWVVRMLMGGFAAAMLAGCAKSYVDPKYKDVTMTDLKRPAEMQRVRLDVEFLTNGSPNTWAAKHVRDRIEQALTKSGTVQLVSGDQTDDVAIIHVVMNNVGDVGDAMAKGFGTGLTFGLVGSSVTDGYVFDATFTPAGGGEPVTKQYRHAIYSTVGNKEGPAGLTPMSPSQAFDQVVQDLVMVFLKDLQAQGYLVRLDLDGDRVQTAGFGRNASWMF